MRTSFIECINFTHTSHKKKKQPKKKEKPLGNNVVISIYIIRCKIEVSSFKIILIFPYTNFQLQSELHTFDFVFKFAESQKCTFSIYDPEWKNMWYLVSRPERKLSFNTCILFTMLYTVVLGLKFNT